MSGIHKDLSISFLFDFYGEMLTEIQKQAIDFYYNQDLSLAEIAQHSGITRQGVRDSIKRAEHQLLLYEEKLGLYHRFHEIQDGLQKIKTSTQLLLEENERLGQSPTIQKWGDDILHHLESLNDET